MFPSRYPTRPFPPPIHPQNTKKKRRATILEAILSYPFSKRSGSKWTSMGRIWRLTRRKWDEWDDNTAVLTSFPQRKVYFFKANASTAMEILPKQSYRGYSAFSSAARFFLPSAPYQIEHNPPYPVPSQPRAWYCANQSPPQTSSSPHAVPVYLPSHPRAPVAL